MNREDKYIQNHISSCKEKRCSECNEIFRNHFIKNPGIKAVYKYQQTAKFKEYKRNYYQNKRDAILQKYHENKVLK